MGAAPHLVSGRHPLPARTLCRRGPLGAPPRPHRRARRAFRRAAPSTRRCHESPAVIARPQARLVGVRQGRSGARRIRRRGWPARPPPAPVIGVGAIRRRVAATEQHPREDEHRRQREQRHEHDRARGQAQDRKQQQSYEDRYTLSGASSTFRHIGILPPSRPIPPGFGDARSVAERSAPGRRRQRPPRRRHRQLFGGSARRARREARGVVRVVRRVAGEVGHEDAVPDLAHQISDRTR